MSDASAVESVIAKLIEHELEVASFNIHAFKKDKEFIVFNNGRIAELKFLASELGFSVKEYQPGAFEVRSASAALLETLADLEHRIKAIEREMTA